jgi:PAS domain-containing protein
LSALRATRTNLTRATQDLADAVLQGDSRRVDRLVHFEIGFGIVGMMAALGLGAIFWRSGRQSESARFQSLVSHATDLLLTTNAKGIVTFASASSVEILGLSQRVVRHALGRPHSSGRPHLRLGEDVLDLGHPEPDCLHVLPDPSRRRTLAVVRS